MLLPAVRAEGGRGRVGEGEDAGSCTGRWREGWAIRVKPQQRRGLALWTEAAVPVAMLPGSGALGLILGNRETVQAR